MTPYTITDAEAELRAAFDAGAKEAIGRLQGIVDGLATHSTPVSLLPAALWYAQEGLAVFPLQPGTKIPLKGSHGCLDASCDPERIRAWWSATPEANIGLATGGLVDVVDIDGHAGQVSRLLHWCEACEAPICDHAGAGSTFVGIERLCVGKVLTPRAGGMHLYIPAQGDPNGANIVPGVDYRGRGGYVVAPPSRTPPDGNYRWLGETGLDLTRLQLDTRAAS